MSTSIGTPIDGAGGRGFGVTERGGSGSNLATDKGGVGQKQFWVVQRGQNATRTERTHW